MELVTPDVGLLFWMLVSFTLLLIILKKFAWKPILNSLREREESISEALSTAEKARAEMEKLKTDNEAIIREARIEKEKILKEAREIKIQIVDKAKQEASQEANKIIEVARLNIRQEKATALDEIKKQVAELSVDIAEKILREKLSADTEQKKLIEKYLEDIRLN
ncbi:MAG: F0F1 ATP synthase subunit B [Bacteroidales bacterium]|nr:F0F1 ATP synthase subunit B [Bacteroidales bacterium]